MVIRELFTRLAYKVDDAGAKKYDAALGQIQAKAETIVTGINNAMRGLAAGLALGATAVAGAIAPIARAGDEMVTNINKIANNLGGIEEATAVYEKLYAAVRETGANLSETAGDFGRFNDAMKDAGRSTDETITLITGLQAAMTAAGVSTAGMSAVTTQLGQAMGSALGGEELNTLRDQMPSLVRYLRTEFNMTAAEFKKAAEKQELTAERLIPPLLRFAEQSNSRLRELPLTMSRAWAGLTTTIARFLAEIDKQFGISEKLARAIRGLSDFIERMRVRIVGMSGAIQAAGRILGGFEGALRLARIALALAFGSTALSMVRGLAVAMWGLARSVLAAMAPILGFAAWVVIFEDFIGWMQGKRSLFGEKFGEFDDVVKPLVDAFESIKEPVTAAFAVLQEKLAALWTGVQEMTDGVRALFLGMVQSIVQAFDGALTKAQEVVAWIRRNFGWMEGTGAGSDPERQGEQRGRFGGRGAAPGFYEGIVPQSFSPPASSMISPSSTVLQTNHINVSAPVTATGASGAEVAAGARQGLATAARDMLTDLGSVARGLNMAMPRAEPATA